MAEQLSTPTINTAIVVGVCVVATITIPAFIQIYRKTFTRKGVTKHYDAVSTLYEDKDGSTSDELQKTFLAVTKRIKWFNLLAAGLGWGFSLVESVYATALSKEQPFVESWLLFVAWVRTSSTMKWESCITY